MTSRGNWVGATGVSDGPSVMVPDSIAMIGSVPWSSMIAASYTWPGLDAQENDWIGRSSDLVSS